MTDTDPTVFVVDDDASVRHSLARLIRSIGFKVEVFSSAREFLNRNHYDGPGCMVLDVRMPGLSGIQFQEYLADVDYNMPIIFITGYGNISMSVKAMKAGAVDFLTKPFNDHPGRHSQSHQAAHANKTGKSGTIRNPAVC